MRGENTMTQTITQRKKGWWKIWVVIAIIAVVIAVIGVLAYLGKIDLAPWNERYLGIFMWGSTSWINATIILLVCTAFGVLLTYIWYTYLRGNKTTQNQYTPPGQTLSQPTQQGTETTVST
jgi:uncharacterized membrane protein YfcA